MEAIEALHNRISVNLLDSPAPTRDELDAIFRAGLRACDHKNLRPWRFLLIEGDDRLSLGELMASVKAECSSDSECLDEDLEKIKLKPMRAPTVIVVVASITEHPKVPEIEQLLSAGAAAQMMMTAAYAQGLGAIWRSGSLMFERSLHDGLGLEANQKIVGFLYVGQIKVCKKQPVLEPEDFVSNWPNHNGASV